MSTSVNIGTVLTIQTRDGTTYTGSVKILERGSSITLQLFQTGPPATKTIAWHEIVRTAVVEPSKVQLNVLKDQVIHCYNQLFQCKFQKEMAPQRLNMTPAEKRELEAKMTLNQNEFYVQKKLLEGLQPLISALSEKDRKMITVAVQQNEAEYSKKVAEAKRLQALHQQKPTGQVKKPVNPRPPTQTKPPAAGAKGPALQVRATTVTGKQQEAYNSPPAMASPSAAAAAAAAKKKKASMTKAGKIGQLIKAMPADKQAGSKVMTKRKLQQLVAQIAPHEKLDEDVEDLLLDIADDFIESVTDFACLLARHRNSKILEVKDVQLHLERNWNMRLPGFGHDHIHPARKPAADIHKQRLNQIKKAQLERK